ncbi:hypothetical protein QFZ83_000428 [Variovorax sp. W1I1]|uniref:hypothetical protein n=1 Tax=Variovorax sp. W1I1 TaxID=3042309 RepID=UPI0027865A2A|nr:hypothetical protein [Variovorax sp. W1I1]MDQ0606257.1 hypothetical protein [Variovorax sp. W1I1]
MLKLGVATIALAALTGCAGVDFYSDATLTKKTGIPIYAPKPYLLVARTGAEDKPVEISVIYLNDVNNVIYAKPRSGFGSNELAMTFTDGRLATFGLKTDPKLAELVTSFAGLLTARAGAAKTRAEADEIRSKIGATAQSAASKKATGDQALGIAADMQTKLTSKSLQGLTDSELKTLGEQAQKLKLAGTALADVTQAATNDGQLDNLNAVAQELGKFGAATASTPRDLSLQIIGKWASSLKKMGSDAAPPKAPEATFELYEIIQSQGSPSLRRVQ